MNTSSHVDNLSIATAGNDGSTLVTKPGTPDSFQVLQDRDPQRSGVLANSEGILPLARRALNRKVALDLRRDCPVCGQPYQSGDNIVALNCLAFAPSTESSPAVSLDSDRKVILGHHGCVLPRLLTLLAGFQPEIRFVKAADESFSPEVHHDEP